MDSDNLPEYDADYDSLLPLLHDKPKQRQILQAFNQHKLDNPDYDWSDDERDND